MRLVRVALVRSIVMVGFLVAVNSAWTANLVANSGFSAGTADSYPPASGSTVGLFATNLTGGWDGINTGTSMGPTVVQRVRGMAPGGSNSDHSAIVYTKYDASGLVQTIDTGGTVDVYYQADVYVVAGRAAVGVGTVAQISSMASTGALGQWVHLSGTGTVQANGGVPITRVAIVSDDSGGGIFFVDNVSVERVLPPIQSLTINPANVIGGRPATGTVTLGQGAPQGGILVQLSDDSPFSGTPTSTTVAQGQTFSNFTVTTTSVVASQTSTVTAQIQASTKTATLGIHPQPPLQSVSVSPSSLDGCYTSQGTVTLATTAPATTVVTLTDSSNYATLPATVNVPFGSSQGFFTINTTGPPATINVTITASLGAVSKTTTLTVRPQHLIQSFSVTPATQVGGNQLQTSVTMNRAVASPFLLVSLSPDKFYVFTGSITVFAPNTSANGTLGTTTVTSNTLVTITASYGQSTKTQTITLTP